MAPNFGPSGLALYILVIVFTTICGLIIVLRFWAMRISRRKFYLDDAFILVAYANVVALGGVAEWSSLNGLGKSSVDLTPYEIAATAKLLFTAYICWLLASVFYKLAILALLKRIFSTTTFRRLSDGISILTGGYCISFFCVYMTNCEPIDYMWNPTPGGHCRDGRSSDYSTLAINIILDLAIMILPMPFIWKLKLPTRKKIVVSVMFGFGFLTIGAMIWRVIWTHMYRANPDFTSTLGRIAIVSSLELWFGIIVANIPTLAPLFRARRFADGRRSLSSAEIGSTHPRRLPFPGPDSSHGSGGSKYSQTVSNQHVLLQKLPNQHEMSEAPRNAAPIVTAECSFSPESQHATSQLASSVIHVRTDVVL